MGVLSLHAALCHVVWSSLPLENGDEPMAVTHLMNDDLLNACGRAVMAELHVAPFTTPERITCKHCRPLIEQQRREQLEQAHAEALAENAAHDAAMTKARELSAELLERYADRPTPMPRPLRTQLAMRKHLSLLVPRT